MRSFWLCFVIFAFQMVLPPVTHAEVCYGRKNVDSEFEGAVKRQVIIHPVICEGSELANLNEGLLFEIEVPEDVVIYKVYVTHTYQEITKEYLESIFSNVLGIATNSLGEYFVWVEPNTKVNVHIPVHAENLSFNPNLFELQYEPYLYKQN